MVSNRPVAIATSYISIQRLNHAQRAKAQIPKRTTGATAMGRNSGPFGLARVFMYWRRLQELRRLEWRR